MDCFYIAWTYGIRCEPVDQPEPRYGELLESQGMDQRSRIHICYSSQLISTILNLSSCQLISTYLSVYISAFPNLSQLISALSLSQLIPTHLNVSQLIPTHLNSSQLVPASLNLSEVILTHVSSSQLISTYLCWRYLVLCILCGGDILSWLFYRIPKSFPLNSSDPSQFKNGRPGSLIPEVRSAF